MKKKILCALFLLFSSINLFALSETDVKFTKQDITDSGGSLIDGEYAVSIQAATLYLQFKDKTMKDLLPMPVKQYFVSAGYENDKSTVYYYEFENYENALKTLNFIKPLIWGESGPTGMHPERIYHLNNYVIIISSHQKNKLDEMLRNKIISIQVPAETVAEIINRIKCDNTQLENPCSILKEFNTVDIKTLKSGKPYFGYAWEINKDGDVTKTFFEVLEIRKKGDDYYGHWFPLKPDNDDEKNQIIDIIKISKQGKKAELSSGLASFLESIYNKNINKMIIKDNSQFFLETKGNLAQLKQFNDKIILLVSTEHWTGKRSSIILAYFWTK